MIKKKNAISTNKFRVGGNIRKWRNIKDIKQKDLANSLKLSEAAVSNIENDVTNITLTQLEEISTILNVTIEQLLSDPQEQYGNPVLVSPDPFIKDQKNPLEKELMHAIISSLEKKDQQLQVMIQHFIEMMNTLLQKEEFFINASKQEVSRV